jgi:hypothetical protein
MKLNTKWGEHRNMCNNLGFHYNKGPLTKIAMPCFLLWLLGNRPGTRRHHAGRYSVPQEYIPLLQYLWFGLQDSCIPRRTASCTADPVRCHSTSECKYYHISGTPDHQGNGHLTIKHTNSVTGLNDNLQLNFSLSHITELLQRHRCISSYNK